MYVELMKGQFDLMGRLSHPHLTNIIDLIEDDNYYYVVTELTKGGLLFDRLRQVKSFSECQAACVVHQIMLGLNYLHQQNIIHRDLKPENIELVSSDPQNFNIKISDLGFAQKFEQDSEITRVMGTPLYMAPELVCHQPYGEKVDVWSLGIIVHQLLCGKTPFDGKSLKRIKHNICNRDVNFENLGEFTDDAKDFIKCCLEKDQNIRPTIAELLSHPWIQKQPIYQQQNNIQNVHGQIQDKIAEYQQSSQLQRLALNMLSSFRLSLDELKKIQYEFHLLDKDKNGTITISELLTMRNSNLPQFKDIDWNAFLQSCDLNGDGVIDFQEFMGVCIDRKILKSEDSIRDAFNILDYNGDGQITIEDLEQLFNHSGGTPFDQDIWQQLLHEADVNSDGVISFEEFKDAMGKTLRSFMEAR